jgi:hypothetical protein
MNHKRLQTRPGYESNGRRRFAGNAAASIAMTASRFSSNVCPHGEGQNIRGEPRIRDRALRNRYGL